MVILVGTHAPLRGGGETTTTLVVVAIGIGRAALELVRHRGNAVAPPDAAVAMGVRGALRVAVAEPAVRDRIRNDTLVVVAGARGGAITVAFAIGTKSVVGFRDRRTGGRRRR